MYFIENNKHFNKEISRRQKWLKNFPDDQAEKEWKNILNKIKSDKKFKKVLLAYNFSKNLNYIHPGLDSDIYFYHPLRVCILSTKIDQKLSSELMTLCLLHNVFETTSINSKIILKVFGKKITHQLNALTVNRKNEFKKNYKNKYYNNLKRMGKNVVITKILDKLDNLYLLNKNKNLKVKKRYINEIEYFLMPLIKKNIKFLYPYFKNLINISKLK